MGKVKLPREVVEAIDACRKETMTDYAIVIYSSNLVEFNGPNHLFPHMEYIRRFCYKSNSESELFMKAIVNGYEVEQTPEDKVREMFSEAVTQEVECVGRSSVWWEGRRMTIVDTLNCLGIKISGVNE